MATKKKVKQSKSFELVKSVPYGNSALVVAEWLDGFTRHRCVYHAAEGITLTAYDSFDEAFTVEFLEKDSIGQDRWVEVKEPSKILAAFIGLFGSLGASKQQLAVHKPDDA
jgi:hypothetical protein